MDLSPTETSAPEALDQEAAVKPQQSLDLPLLLPLLLVSATWEFLVLRIIVPVMGNGGEELERTVFMLRKLGVFSQAFSAILCIVLLSEAAVSLARARPLGPITHRITVSGFAAIVVVVCSAALFFRVGPDVALMAHAAAIFLSLLLVLSLLWHRGHLLLVVGACLLLIPTLMRFYASCSIAVPLLRTDSDVPWLIYRCGELVAVVTALVAPFVFARLSWKRLLLRPPLASVCLSSLPAMALAVALTGSTEQVRVLCHSSVGFSLDLWPSYVPQYIIYPAALFAFLLACSALVLPGITPAGRSSSDQRIGFGMILLFLAGLDTLDGPVLALIVGGEDVQSLVPYLLRGDWRPVEGQTSLIGPPIRDLYRVALVALSYVLITRGIQDRRSSTLRTGDPPEGELS